MKQPSFFYYAEMDTIEGLDVFCHREICDTILDSLYYCRKQKHMQLHGYLILKFKLYLLFALEGDPSYLIRDFKKQSSRLISNYVINDLQHPCRERWLSWMYDEGSVNQKVKYFQFWKHGTCCRLIDDTKVFEQMLDWLHQQPVCEGLVLEAIY
jgi:putative transposase